MGQNLLLNLVSLLLFVFPFDAFAQGVSLKNEKLGIALPYSTWEIDPLRLSDPVHRLIFSNIAEGLMRPSGIGKVELGIALKVTPYEENKKWDVLVSKNTKLSSGKMLLSEDVIGSFTFYRDKVNEELSKPSAKGKASSEFVAKILNIESVALKNTDAENYTFTFSLKNADEHFSSRVLTLPLLDSDVLHAFGEHAFMGTNISTLGSYFISENKPRRGMLLEQSKATHVSPSYSKELEFRTYEDPALALSALRVGTVAIIPLPTLSMIESAEKDPTLKVMSSPFVYLASLTGPWQLENAYWADSNVPGNVISTQKIITRQGLNVDPQMLVRFNLSGTFLP